MRKSSPAKKNARGAATPRKTGKPTPPGPLARLLADGRTWGALLIAGGLVAGLGVYLDAAGPAGFVAEVSLGLGLGMLRLVAPPLMIAAGWLLFRGPSEEARTDSGVHPGAAAVVLLATLAGLLHVTRGGADSSGDALARLENGGGLVGMALGKPLMAVTSPLAAAALLSLAAIALLAFLTRFSPTIVTDRLALLWDAAMPAIRQRAGELFRSVADPDAEPRGARTRRPATANDARAHGGALFDQDETGGRRRRRAAEVPAVMGDRVEVQVPADDLAALVHVPEPSIAPIDLLPDPPDPGSPDVNPAGATNPGPAQFGNPHPAPGSNLGEGTPGGPESDIDGDLESDINAAPGALDTRSHLDGRLEGRNPVQPAEPKVWKLPPANVLGRSSAQQVDRQAVAQAGRTLEHALAQHGVETRLVNMVVGPTVTRYELELGPGVKVARVTSLHKDIAYAMATPDVRILAPIPGRQAIGVEVPNVERQLVTIGDILSSEEARKADQPLEVAIGRDIAGRSVLANLARMPHVLIAGATGAGKSSCINVLITSILMRSTPDEVRMILIDPKRVELGQYNRLPHLLTQVVTNPKKAANALNWAVREMERRYDLLSEVGVRDITGYNAAFDRGDLAGERSEVLAKTLGFNNPDVDVTFPRLPYVLIVVDELNDLMMVAARDVEDAICRIAQMARAVGIHLVVATQRPSVNVITGVIKANIPARLAFAVSSLADSRVILDQAGAERLVGRGDMLIIDGSSSTAQRLQGAWVTEDEVRAVAAHWRRQSPETQYVQGVEGAEENDQLDLFSGGAGGAGGTGDEDDEQLVRQARELIVRSQFGSTSMLQRKLRVGFARAGRLMDLLEQAGVVGPSTGSKAREVLMSPEELDEPVAPGG
ncbi:MAG: DNA translocase FtsK [Acidimicrobiales bacterium]